MKRGRIPSTAISDRAIQGYVSRGFEAVREAFTENFVRRVDYDERVCTYWPEFAQNSKERITVRQSLAHQAGLFAINERADRGVVADLDRLAVVLARQKPAWEPGSRQAYHALTLGFYEGELLRRVDPRIAAWDSSSRMKSRHG